MKFSRFLWRPVIIGLSWLSALNAFSVTLRFDELPFQPVNGLSVLGVTFGFEVAGSPSDDANYNAGGPGSTAFIDDPSLEGDAAGTLSFDFAPAVPSLSFGVALSTFTAVVAGASVQLYDDNGLLVDTIEVDLLPVVSVAEGEFSWSAGLVGRAVVQFDSSAASRFAVDNLAFATVPDSGPFLLISILLWGGLMAARRSKAFSRYNAVGRAGALPPNAKPLTGVFPYETIFV
jgi:hypothetical protein